MAKKTHRAKKTHAPPADAPPATPGAPTSGATGTTPSAATGSGSATGANSGSAIGRAAAIRAKQNRPTSNTSNASNSSGRISASGEALWLPALALVGAALLIYFQVLNAKFIWDDDVHFFLNPNMTSLAGLGRIWGKDAFYYPLTTSSFWLLRRTVGLDAPLYHLINILVHGANAALLWRVLKGLGLPGAWLAGLIFAVHPVNVQSAAWVTELKNTQSGFFYLLSALMFFRHDRAPDAPGARRWFALSLALFTLALLSKTSTVTLPFGLIVGRLAMANPPGRPPGHPHARPLDLAFLLRVAPFFALSAVAGGLTTFMHGSHVAGAAWSESPAERVALAGRAFWFYAGKLAWPSDLSFVYPRWDMAAAGIWAWAWPLALIAAAAALLAARGPLSRALGLAGAYYLLSLLPVLHFFKMYYTLYSYAADHWQYLACMGPFALAGAGLAALVDRARRAMPSANAAAVWACALLPLLALPALTIRQSRAYLTLPDLWRDTLRKNPTCWLAWNGMGQIHEMLNQTDDAISAFRSALANRPGDSLLMNNLGLNLMRANRIDEAMDSFAQAIKANPTDATGHDNLGRARLMKGNPAGALEPLAEAIRLKPKLASARANLGIAYTKLGRPGDAEKALRAALELDPSFDEARENLARLMADAGRRAEAVRLLNERRLNPALLDQPRR